MRTFATSIVQGMTFYRVSIDVLIATDSVLPPAATYIPGASKLIGQMFAPSKDDLLIMTDAVVSIVPVR